MFDGTSSAKWAEYNINFEQIAEWNGWSNIQKAKMLSIKLRGEAQKLLGCLTPDQYNDYNILKTTITQIWSQRKRGRKSVWISQLPAHEKQKSKWLWVCATAFKFESISVTFKFSIVASLRPLDCFKKSDLEQTAEGVVSQEWEKLENQIEKNLWGYQIAIQSK